MLLVDNDDCFIHTLANYARQTGAEVVTYRAGFPPELIDEIHPDLILISPGPGRPADFGVPDVVRRRRGSASRCSACASGCRGSSRRSAANWACWITRCTASRRPSSPRHRASSKACRQHFQVGRYHSLFATQQVAGCLEVTAETEDGVSWASAIANCRSRPCSFIPSPCLSLDEGCGLRLMRNVVTTYGRARALAEP